MFIFICNCVLLITQPKYFPLWIDAVTCTMYTYTVVYTERIMYTVYVYTASKQKDKRETYEFCCLTLECIRHYNYFVYRIFCAL